MLKIYIFADQTIFTDDWFVDIAIGLYFSGLADVAVVGYCTTIWYFSMFFEDFVIFLDCE